MPLKERRMTGRRFPAAVWAWNAMIALVCGDTVVWKPSESASLTALACDALLRRAARDEGAPDGIHQLVHGGTDVGTMIVDDPRITDFFEEYWRNQNVPEPTASCVGAIDGPGKQRW